ncbi:MAG: DUF302 domain-containing protein [Candidatus Promineofilum sp.]|jgi:uncharacterized protein (DUF302 family)|nr:DUF302 domain-containing protein [Promineifilum sp.]
MNQTSIDYGMRTHLNAPYETAIEQVTAALKAEGFGVLTTIDVKATLKQKLDVDFRRYVILGACNPPLAHRALSTELEIGLLLPCNVIVYEDESGAGSVVSIVDPQAMLGAGINPALAPVADEAAARLRRVLESLNAS